MKRQIPTEPSKWYAVYDKAKKFRKTAWTRDRYASAHKATVIGGGAVSLFVWSRVKPNI